jgi:hypothetical protein
VKAAAKPAAKSSKPPAALPVRITSIDALRGFVMFMMIYVNDLAGAGKIVPDWMVHFSDRHRGGSGMTFVDLVFPAFLFSSWPETGISESGMGRGVVAQDKGDGISVRSRSSHPKSLATTTLRLSDLAASFTAGGVRPPARGARIARVGARAIPVR